MIGDWTAARTRRMTPESVGLLGRESRLRQSDWVLTAAVLSLSLIGVLLVAAATSRTAANKLHPYSITKHQILFLLIGLVLAVIAAMADYRAVRSSAPVIYVLGLLGLLATFAIGTSVAGAKAWISIGAGLTIQPSEFAKLAVIVLVAMLFNAAREDRREIGDLDVLRALLLMGFPMLLILKQNDLGTMLVMVAIVFGVLAVGGVPTRWMLALTGLMIVGTVFIVKLHMLSGYQQGRITAYLHPDSPAVLKLSGYNAHQARLAIGSGGIKGTGLFHGPLINNGSLFAAHTDFIFATAGEELGFIGASVIILLLGVVLWRGMRIAAHAPDLFGRVVAAGIVCWLAFESFENIGMNLGIMPVTGIPLQFVSYGGSSMFASMLAIGLLQNVHIQTKAATTSSRL
ncbi:MAG: rod shape determining protein RodA [Actinomycetota bacterium]|nr:rod shape determining protein RodA [Actinomycetota bacterium]